MQENVKGEAKFLTNRFCIERQALEWLSANFYTPRIRNGEIRMVKYVVIVIDKQRHDGFASHSVPPPVDTPLRFRSFTCKTHI